MAKNKQQETFPLMLYGTAWKEDKTEQFTFQQHLQDDLSVGSITLTADEIKQIEG